MCHFIYCAKATITMMNEEEATIPQLKKKSTKSTEKGSPTSSDDSLVVDDPNYISPDKQNFLLLDVTSKALHSKISKELEVEYLSPASGGQTSPIHGLLFGSNCRLMVNIETRRRSRRVNGPKYDVYNVTFLCDSGSPNTFICAEAMGVLLGRSSEDALPDTLAIQLADFPFIVEAHLSTKPSHYEDVNVIGMDVLRQLKVTIYGKNLSFEMEHMDGPI